MAYVAMILEKENEHVKALVERIVVLRRKLNQLWEERHCTDEAILDVSRELDEVVNQYQRAVQWEMPTY